MAELLRPGKAGSNTAADHVAAFDAALHSYRRRCAPTTSTGAGRCWYAPTPPARPRSSPPTCTDTAWSSRSGRRWALRHRRRAHPAAEVGVDPGLSGPQPRAAETGVQIQARDGAWVAEATGVVDLSSWPPGTRLILRKERPHPGAQLRITDADGHTRHRVPHQHRTGGPPASSPTSNCATAATPASRTASAPRRTPGMRNLPFHDMNQNRIWLAVAALAADLLAWTARLALPATAAVYEPKRLRLRILATAGRLVRAAPPPHPAHRLILALGRGDHRRPRPALRASGPLTTLPTRRPRPGAPADPR